MAQTSHGMTCLFLATMLLAGCGGLLAPSETQRFIRASEQARAGDCDGARSLVATLSPAWQGANPGAVPLLEGLCRYYGDGQLAEGEALIKGVADGDSLLATLAAGMEADVRAHACDFDAALRYVYVASGEANRQAYLADYAVGQAALYYLLQGRPELARRNAALYLGNYPADWYQSSRSDAPAGISYDKKAHELDHRTLRAWAVLVLVTLGETVDLQADADAVRALVAVDWRPTMTRGAAFASTDAAHYDRALELVRLDAGIALASRLSLSEAEVGALHSVRGGVATALNGADGLCRAVVMQALSRASTPEAPAVDVNVAPSPEPVAAEAPAEVGAARLVERQVVIAQQVHFDTDEATLLAESRPVLDDVATLLREHPEVRRVRVEGHTDSRGTEAHNLELSQRRAEAVRDYLVERGLEASRLEAMGFGEAQPLEFGDTEQAWAVNRRVEFLVLEKEPGAASAP